MNKLVLAIMIMGTIGGNVLASCIKWGNSRIRR